MPETIEIDLIVTGNYQGAGKDGLGITLYGLATNGRVYRYATRIDKWIPLSNIVGKEEEIYAVTNRNTATNRSRS